MPHSDQMSVISGMFTDVDGPLHGWLLPFF
jgi:hypothetical protein